MTWRDYRVEVTIVKYVKSHDCHAAFYEAGRMTGEYLKRTRLIKDDITVKYKVSCRGRKLKSEPKPEAAPAEGAPA